MLFVIFEKGMTEKIAPGIWRFVSMLFLKFENGMSEKNIVRNFKVHYYAIFSIWKSDEHKNCAANFQIRKCAFLLFEQGTSEKFALGILRFVSVLY